MNNRNRLTAEFVRLLAQRSGQGQAFAVDAQLVSDLVDAALAHRSADYSAVRKNALVDAAVIVEHEIARGMEAVGQGILIKLAKLQESA